MKELEANDYTAAAREALNGGPDYNRRLSALAEEREALSEKGRHSGTVEGLLFFIWNQRFAAL